jgi:trafficking kinesin-binding protein 1
VDLSEVDLISLVEEQIPLYKLRADTITTFSGYQHADFIQTPVLPANCALDLSLELIEETLKYFRKSNVL